jgi:hypothetical protein
MTVQQRLLDRLRAEGADLPPCTVLRRTYRTRRTGIGRWSWFAYCPHSAWEPGHERHDDLKYGSHWPMCELLAADKLAFQTQPWGSICVDPAGV